MKVFLGVLALLGLAHAEDKKGPLVTDKVSYFLETSYIPDNSFVESFGKTEAFKRS